MPYCPFRHFPHPVTQVGFVRLACLIHAANVRSEPGSNPSKKVRFSPQKSLACASGFRGVCEPEKSLRSPKSSTQRTRGNNVSIAAGKDESDLKARRILALAHSHRLV